MPSLKLQFHPAYDRLNLRARILQVFHGGLEGAEQVESSGYARVLKFEAPYASGTRPFFYKEFLFRNLRDRLSVLFRASRARRAWSGSYLLLDHGFLTALPVCVGERRVLAAVTRSFLVTEAVPDALEVEVFIRSAFYKENRPAIAGKRRFIRHIGRTIGTMHRLGIFQGDLRQRNILAEDDDPAKIYLIDNERTRLYRKLPDRKRLKNLVQINMIRIEEITTTDRIRFFYAYLEQNPDLAPLKRKWMHKILQKTRTRLIKKGRLT